MYGVEVVPTLIIARDRWAILHTNRFSLVTVSRRSRRILKIKEMAKFSGLLLFGLFISVALAIKIIKYEKEEEKQDFSKIPGISHSSYIRVHLSDCKTKQLIINANGKISHELI